MGVEQGYSKIATSGLVFAYDTGDQRNSYKGKPGYNVAANVADSIGNNNITYDPGYFFITTVGAETVNIPALGTYDNVRFCAINNGYTGYGTGGNFNCCPALFNYGLPMTVGVTGNTLYTYSIIYKTQSGYTNPNFMYRYEYNVGTYLTEAGAFDASKRVDLGDGWYWAYNTFTTQPTCDRLFLYLFYYQYNTPDKVWVKDAMIVQGDYKLPPLNFLSGNQTRSSTQGLLDISGTGTSINLSNVSFNSNAQYYFDGTDDYIDFGTVSAGMGGASQATMELVINMTFPSSLQQLFGFRNDSTFDFFFLVFAGGGSEFRVRNSAGTIYDLNPALASYAGKPTHIVFCVGPEGRKVYANGVLIASNATWTGTLGSSAPFNIGRNAGNIWFANGAMPVAKLYTKQLTANEVLSNFNHYKTRFNIT
jgi:hypothetical protein